MALTVASVTNIDSTQNQLTVKGTITTSANYGSASSHGDTLSLAGLGVPSGAVPSWVQIVERPAAGTAQTGWTWVFNPGTTQANGVVQMLGNSTSGQGDAEYTQGSAYASATPAAPTTLYFRAEFAKV
tara:strand:- start:4345 stop:4728 length:384 start_codon:yes stop_codon:yes gene_type:complete